MSGRLEGKVAVVTGAGRGIGKAIAKRFATEGATVVAAQRSHSEGQEVVDQIVAAGGAAICCETDVRDPVSVKTMIDRALTLTGNIDALCNNAGVGLIRSVTDTTDEEYAQVMDVNLRGVFLTMRETIPAMVRAGRGSVINIASVASFVGFPNDAAYCASKGAVLMLTRQAALDYAKSGVRVNAICPGFIITPMLDTYCTNQENPETALQDVVDLHPMGRLGTGDDVAAAAAFFASDETTWITGAALPVDGGLLCQ